MLIIYDNDGKIKFTTSDDYYVGTYLKKHGKLPFIQYGTKSLWLQGEPFLQDNTLYKIIDNKLVKRNEIEINAILESRKNIIKRKIFKVKNIELVEMTEEESNVKTTK
jgi:hypothetical protein